MPHMSCIPYKKTHYVLLFGHGIAPLENVCESVAICADNIVNEMRNYIIIPEGYIF